MVRVKDIRENVVAIEHRVVMVTLAVIARQVLVPARYDVAAGGITGENYEFQRYCRGFVVRLDESLDLIAGGSGFEEGRQPHRVTLAPPPLEQRLEGIYYRAVSRADHQVAG